MTRLPLLCVALTIARTLDPQPVKPGTPPGEQTQATSQAVSQPAASQPADRGRTLRRPAQAEIIEKLLRERERPTVILPQEPGAAGAGDAARGGAGNGAAEGVLLVEGTVLVERPGRLVWQKGKPMFAFFAEGGRAELQTMELLPNQLLEALEREAGRGAAEFVISARVTRYKECNYLLLLKVLRRVGHGNLAP